MRQFYSLLFSAILAAHLLTPAQAPGGHGDESIYENEEPVYGVVQKGKALETLPGQHITQQDVNDFIVRSKKAGTLTAKTLVDQLIIWGIKVLAFDFDGTLTEAHSQGRLNLGDSKKVNAIYDGVTPDFLAIARESYRRLRLYVVSFGDEGFCEKLSDKEKKLCLAGKPLMESVLLRKGVAVDEIYGYYPKFYQTPEAYRLVNPDAKKGEKMPNSKAFHLHLVERHAGVPPHQIILFDDTLENCKDAVKRGYFAVGVKPEGKVKGLRFTTMSPVVLP